MLGGRFSEATDIFSKLLATRHAFLPSKVPLAFAQLAAQAFAKAQYLSWSVPTPCCHPYSSVEPASGSRTLGEIRPSASIAKREWASTSAAGSSFHNDIGVLRAKVPHAKLFSANFFASGPAASPTSWQRRVGVRFAVS